MSTRILNYEDSYDAYGFDSFEDLMANFNEMCTDDLYGAWNVPVWITYDEDIAENLVKLGLMQTRHGRCVQWIAPATEAQANELQAAMLRVWAGRAEHRFARHMYQRDALAEVD